MNVFLSSTLVIATLLMSACSNNNFSGTANKPSKEDPKACVKPSRECPDRVLSPISSTNDTYATSGSLGLSSLKTSVKFLEEGDQITEAGLESGNFSTDFSKISFTSSPATELAESGLSSEISIQFSYIYADAVTLYKNQKLFVKGKDKNGTTFNFSLNLDILLKKSGSPNSALPTVICDGTAGIGSGNCSNAG